MMNMEDEYKTRSSQSKERKKSGSTKVIVILAIVAIAGFAFGISQFIMMMSVRSDLQALEEKLIEVEEKKVRLQDQYDEIYEENQELRDENKMLRSSRVIEHGSREIDKVAITINNGAQVELIERALDYLDEYDVQVTFFPMGSWVESEPEVWLRAVRDGHELGNSTYSHPLLTRVSTERVIEEIEGWEQAIEDALGEPYQTLFFRPPYGDGFLPGQGYRGGEVHEIIAEKGMFPVLWDLELIYALRNEPYTPERVAEYVINNARGGSIILLHFNPQDIAALPDILEGLRERDLTPCTLSEMLVAR